MPDPPASQSRSSCATTHPASESDARVFVQTKLSKYYGDFHTVTGIPESTLDHVIESTLKSPRKVPLKNNWWRSPSPCCSSSSQHPGPYFLGHPGMPFSSVKMLRSFVSDNRRQIFWWCKSMSLQSFSGAILIHTFRYQILMFCFYVSPLTAAMGQLAVGRVALPLPFHISQSGC